MAVQYQETAAECLLPIEGIRLTVAQAGVKKEHKDDVTVMILDEGCTVGAVFTQNRFCAAPVRLCQQHLNQPHDIRALIVNTGNANAGTGKQGQERALAVCQSLAQQLACRPEQILPFSTGVILEPLPYEKIIKSLPSAQDSDWLRAARAIMTTDTIAKAASRTTQIDDCVIKATGIAKGAGMICPNMATMLSFIACDAKISAPLLQQLSKEVADLSFNCITVDGDTSTNDSFVIIATGKSNIKEISDSQDPRYATLKTMLVSLALELAQAIVRDGEGATKFISIEVEQAKNVQEAKQIAYAIAHSPLVKTAFFASDPNLGRLLATIGYAGIHDLDTEQLRMYLGDVLVAEQGGRANSYTEEQGQAVMNESEITLRIELNRGHERATVYTCDLSHDYVSINADYRS